TDPRRSPASYGRRRPRCGPPSWPACSSRTGTCSTASRRCGRSAAAWPSRRTGCCCRSVSRPKSPRPSRPLLRRGMARRLLARAASVQEVFPAELDGPLARFAHGDELYVPVSVEAEEEDVTYDLTVEGVHEYLVHNAVTHNSGGKTRRAAKMVILNVDHPDV